MTDGVVKILVIEDDEDDYEILMRSLKKLSRPIDICWLKDGEEAVRYFNKLYQDDSLKSIRHIAFLDINLPKINGFEVARRIKDFSGAGKIFLIMLSGSDHKKDRAQAESLGVNFFIKKPCEKQEFIEFVDTIGKIIDSSR